MEDITIDCSPADCYGRRRTMT